MRPMGQASRRCRLRRSIRNTDATAFAVQWASEPAAQRRHCRSATCRTGFSYHPSAVVASMLAVSSPARSTTWSTARGGRWWSWSQRGRPTTPRHLSICWRKLRVDRTGSRRTRTRPERVRADKAYSSCAVRRELRRRGITAVIPQPSDQIAHRKRRGSRGGRPPASTPQTTKGATLSSAASTSSNSGEAWPTSGVRRSRSEARRTITYGRRSCRNSSPQHG